MKLIDRFFNPGISREFLADHYRKTVVAHLAHERDVAIASSRMHHTSLIIAGMMNETFNEKKLQFEIALEKILLLCEPRLKKDHVARMVDEINTKLIILLPYPLPDELFEQVRIQLSDKM